MAQAHDQHRMILLYAAADIVVDAAGVIEKRRVCAAYARCHRPVLQGCGDGRLLQRRHLHEVAHEVAIRLLQLRAAAV